MNGPRSSIPPDTLVSSENGSPQTRIELELPPALLEAVAKRAAEIVLERLEPRPSESEFLSVDEAAELLRCKPQRIYDMRSDGRLSRVGDGSRALVRRAELVALTLPNGGRSRTGREIAR